MSEAAPTQPGGTAPRETPWRMVLQLAGVPRLALILALMLATAVTEGVGLLLLVPVLQALDPAAGTGGGLGGLVPEGLRSLGTLLVLFLGLVIARAVAASWHLYEAARLTARVIDGLRARALAALLHAEWGYLAAMRQTQRVPLGCALLGIVAPAEILGDEHAPTLGSLRLAHEASPRSPACIITMARWLCALVNRGAPWTFCMS